MADIYEDEEQMLLDKAMAYGMNNKFTKMHIMKYYDHDKKYDVTICHRYMKNYGYCNPNIVFTHPNQICKHCLNKIQY